MGTTPATILHETKSLARRLVDRHPRALKNNFLYYELQRTRAYHRMRTRPELTERQDLLDALVANGIAIVPEYVPRGEVEAMMSEADEVLERAHRGELPEQTFTVQPHIV